MCSLYQHVHLISFANRWNRRKIVADCHGNHTSFAISRKRMRSCLLMGTPMPLPPKLLNRSVQPPCWVVDGQFQSFVDLGKWSWWEMLDNAFSVLLDVVGEGSLYEHASFANCPLNIKGREKVNKNPSAWTTRQVVVQIFSQFSPPVYLIGGAHEFPHSLHAI